jgi:hypothetical protein
MFGSRSILRNPSMQQLIETGAFGERGAHLSGRGVYRYRV